MTQHQCTKAAITALASLAFVLCSQASVAALDSDKLAGLKAAPLARPR